MTTREIIIKAYNKYACLQKEEFYIDYEEDKCITLRWHVFMDRFVNKAFLKRVANVANYLKKYVDVPIYDSFGNIYNSINKNKSLKKELENYLHN